MDGDDAFLRDGNRCCGDASRCRGTPTGMDNDVACPPPQGRKTNNAVGLPRGCKRNAEIKMHFAVSLCFQW